jgi:hypothetical protein
MGWNSISCNGKLLKLQAALPKCAVDIRAFFVFLNNERAFSPSPYTYQSPAHLKPLARWSMKPFTSSGG